MERQSIEMRFHEWDEILNKDASLRNSQEPIAEEDFTQTNLKTVDLLDELFSHVRSEAKLKADWQDTKVVFGFYQIEVINRVDKLKSDFTLSVWPSAFKLQGQLKYKAFLQSVGDKFWLELASLFTTGKVSLHKGDLNLSIKEKKENQSILKNDASVFFSLIRDHMLNAQENTDNQLFGLEVSWPRDMAWNDLIPQMIRALQILYKLEMMLYRCAYLCRSRVMKQALKKQIRNRTP